MKQSEWYLRKYFTAYNSKEVSLKRNHSNEYLVGLLRKSMGDSTSDKKGLILASEMDHCNQNGVDIFWSLKREISHCEVWMDSTVKNEQC